MRLCFNSGGFFVVGIVGKLQIHLPIIEMHFFAIVLPVSKWERNFLTRSFTDLYFRASHRRGKVASQAKSVNAMDGIIICNVSEVKVVSSARWRHSPTLRSRSDCFGVGRDASLSPVQFPNRRWMTHASWGLHLAAFCIKEEIHQF